MSAPKHTPGPWVVDYAMNQMSGTWVYRIGPITFTQHSGGKVFDELHANARLIAAAPALLEALQLEDRIAEIGLVQAANEGLLAKSKAMRRAAIAAATGGQQ